MNAPKNLHDVFVEELKDLHNAEQQLVRALPQMAAAASHEELKASFREHFEQTEIHVLRLDHIARMLNLSLIGKKCRAMEGLILEGEEKLAASGDDSAKDASLIGAAQKTEHYEMAGYGTVRTYARLLGYPDVALILQRTLDEEGSADKRLTYLAESINVEANV